MTIQTSLSVIVSLEYDRLCDQPRPQWSELLDGIPSTTLIEIVAWLNAKIYANETSQEIQKEIVEFLLQRQDSEFIKRFKARISDILSNGSEFSIVSNQSSVILIEKILENYTPGEARDLTVEEEERLIKAYLLATQEWVDEDLKVFRELKSLEPENLAKFALPHFLPFEDLKRFRDFRWQIFKSVEFFSYVEQHEVLKEHLQLFLNSYSASSWQEYIYHILNCFLSLYKPTEGTGAKLLTSDNDPICAFLDSLSISDPTNYEKKIDFVGLREKPIYKIAPNSYVFYNYSFFIDKLFQTIVFDFGTFLKNMGVVKDIPDFKSNYYSESFYEQYFLYQLVRYMIGKRKKCVAIDGLEWEALTGEKGPDFYIRCGSKIFIIEFKDAIFQAKAKISRDYETIKSEILKKLKSNEKGKQKGITQLAILSNNLAEKGFEFDNFDDIEVKIYPVLIVTDEVYNSYGINYILNAEYQTLLGEPAKRVSEDLLIIHIDTLIEMQDIIHDRRVPVQDCIQWYYDYVSTPSNPHNQFLSFSHFITVELDLRGKKVDILPRKLMKQLPRITEMIENSDENNK